MIHRISHTVLIFRTLPRLGLACLLLFWTCLATRCALADTPRDPNKLTVVNGTLFFEARDAAHGYELWRSDGTAAGTWMVKDINPGTGHSTIGSLTDVNGTLFFSADDGTNGWELWKSNGTEAGTVLVKDIKVGPLNSGPNELININGTLFFTAQATAGDDEVWKSNGTAAGTVPLKDINPGTGGSFPSQLVNVNGTLFFVADDGTNGQELWKSNGTDLGTVLVKNIHPTDSSSPYYLTNVNGTLFFQANDGTNGVELWKSNGTSGGTVIVKNINPGAADGGPYDLINFNGTLFFTANDGTTGEELWKSNGTETGTVLVKDINPNAANSSPYYPKVVNNTLFFAAESNGATGLWKSNGTDAGTVLVKNIVPGAEFGDVNGTLYLAADDGVNGDELWKSNGTSAGTTLVENINPTADSSPHNLTTLGGILYFSAYDGAEPFLWRSNGTAVGTYPIADSVAPPLYSISGRVYDSRGYGIAGVGVTRGAGTPAVTNSAGYFTLTNVPDGTFTLTPSRKNYSFTPLSRSVTVFNSNVGGQNFVGKTGINISGRISNSRGTQIAGVTVNRSDAGPAGVTNSAGYYTLIGVQPGNITLTPVRNGYHFTPVSRIVTAGTTDISGINFIGASGYNIVGRITNSSGAAVVNVAVTRTGQSTPVYTNSAGYFTFNDVPNGTYTLRPSGAGLSFSPESRNVTMNSADITGQNFIAAPGFQITGRVTNSSGTAIAGVTVTRSGSSTAAVTNSAGYYTFNGVANGTYTLTPSLSGFTFTPVTRTATVNGANVANQNFISSP